MGIGEATRPGSRKSQPWSLYIGATEPLATSIGHSTRRPTLAGFRNRACQWEGFRSRETRDLRCAEYQMLAGKASSYQRHGTTPLPS